MAGTRRVSVDAELCVGSRLCQMAAPDLFP